MRSSYSLRPFLLDLVRHFSCQHSVIILQINTSSSAPRVGDLQHVRPHPSGFVACSSLNTWEFFFTHDCNMIHPDKIWQFSSSRIRRSSGFTPPSYSFARVHCYLQFLLTYFATIWVFRNYRRCCIGIPVVEDVSQIWGFSCFKLICTHPEIVFTYFAGIALYIYGMRTWTLTTG